MHPTLQTVLQKGNSTTFRNQKVPGPALVHHYKRNALKLKIKDFLAEVEKVDSAAAL